MLLTVKAYVNNNTDVGYFYSYIYSVYSWQKIVTIVTADFKYF